MVMFNKSLFILVSYILSYSYCKDYTLSDFHEDGNFIRNEFFQAVSIKILEIPRPTLCQLQLAYIVKHWKTPNIIKIFDSWGKVPPGLLTGNLYAMGNFEECINIHRDLQKPFGSLRGQYCRAMIPLTTVGKEITETDKFVDRIKGNENSGNQSIKIYFSSGICIPKSCSIKHLKEILPFKIKSCKVKERVSLKVIDYVAISISSVLLFLLIIGTTYDYIYSGPNKNPFLIAFSVPSNAEKLFHISIEKKKSNIECLNGIRVLSMIWVVFGHTFIANILVPKINYIDYFPWSRTLYSVLYHNAFISVDSFFLISGLLLSWIGMSTVEKKHGKLNVPLMYIHRYLRLTPMVAFVLLFIMSFLKFMGNGPLFENHIKGTTVNCDKYWWMTLLYIQNYASIENFCMPQTWYLAADFQLFLLSPLILYAFWRWKQKTFIGIAVLISLSIGCIYGTFYKYGITGALIVNGKHPVDRNKHYYFRTHTRYAIWLIGMSFGYFLYKSKDKKLHIPKYAQLIGWISTFSILYSVVFAPHNTIHGYEMNDSVFIAATFESFGKIGWGLMMCWVIFVCYHGYGGVVNSFLSCPFWQPFARISFAMYMTHMHVIAVLQGNSQTSEYFSNLELILKFWGNFGITVLVSIALTLAVEYPVLGLENQFLKKAGELDKKEKNCEVNYEYEEKFKN